MIKTRLLLLTLIALLIANPQGGRLPIEQEPIVQPVKAATAPAAAPQVVDMRVRVLSAYLAKHKSPMTENAGDFIEAADKYGLDWKLVPAITGVESTFGKHVPGGLDTQYTSYNAWGWGVYGTNVIKFKSWRDGIFTVSEGLKTRYIDKGLTNPYAINKVYAASPTWGKHVSFFLEDLEEFTQNYSVNQIEKEPELILPIQNGEIFPANQAANTYADNPVATNLVQVGGSQTKIVAPFTISQIAD